MPLLTEYTNIVLGSIYFVTTIQVIVFTILMLTSAVLKSHSEFGCSETTEISSNNLWKIGLQATLTYSAIKIFIDIPVCIMHHIIPIRRSKCGISIRIISTPQNGDRDTSTRNHRKFL